MPKHATKTSFSKDNPRPGPGRPRLTEEQKRQARIQRLVDYDFKQACREALPINTDEVIRRLERGTLKDSDLLHALEILRDSVHGRPAQVISGPDGGPLVGTFVAMLGQVDGARVEKLVAPAVEKAQSNGNGSHEKI